MLTQLSKPGLGTTTGYSQGVDFFIENQLSGTIFNNYDIGSYLAYRLFPKERVFVDTRPEAYPAMFFQQIYLSMFGKLATFQRIEKKFGFNTIMYGYTNGVPHDMGFLRYLVKSKDWKLVYLDGNTIIFVKNNKRNDTILKKYAMSDATFRIPNDNSIASLLSMAYFLKLIGWKNAALETNQKVYELDHSNCIALYNLISQLGPQNPDAAMYLNSFYSNRCKK